MGKTECIVFGSKQKLKKARSLNIIVNNVTVEVTKCIKYLGAYIDENLSGNVMFDYIIKKINSTSKFLYRNKSFFNFDVRKMLVNSLIQPRFDYACQIWYRSIGKTKQSQLQRCQNKCMRFICDYPSRHHISFKDFKKLNYLSVSKRVDYLTLCNMYNIINKQGPSYQLELIKPCSHKHSTRQNVNSVEIESVKTFGKSSFYFNGSKLWNNLDNKIKCCNSKSIFKNLCKKYLMKSMESAANCEFIYY